MPGYGEAIRGDVLAEKLRVQLDFERKTGIVFRRDGPRVGDMVIGEKEPPFTECWFAGLYAEAKRRFPATKVNPDAHLGAEEG